jgi:hypothetical protein
MMMRYHEARTAAPWEKAMQLEDYLDFQGPDVIRAVGVGEGRAALLDAHAEATQAGYEDERPARLDQQPIRVARYAVDQRVLGRIHGTDN